MNDTIKPPAPFDPIPVGGPAAVLDMSRPLPSPPRPPPRQTMPLPPLPDAEPPKSPAPQRAALPVAVAPETPPTAEANPPAGSPPPKTSVFSSLVWDLIRPNRAKVAVLAGLGSLAVGAFGLNMLFPTFGTTPSTEQSKVKLKIAVEEPKPLAAAPKGFGGLEPTATDPKPLPPRVGETGREPVKPADGLPALPALPSPGGAEQPGYKPLEAPVVSLNDPNVRPVGGTGGMPPAPITPAPLPLPGGPAGPLPALSPGGPVASGGAGDLPGLPGLPAVPGAGGPKPLELPPLLPGGGLPPVGGVPVALDPVKPTLPGLPPVVGNPFADDKKSADVKPLPPVGGTPEPMKPTLPGLPPVVGNPFADGNKSADVKPPPLPALPGVGGDPLAGVGPPPLPGFPGSPAPGGPEVKPLPLPLPTPTPGEVKPLDLKPPQPEPLPLGTPLVPAARPGYLEPVVGAGAVGRPTAGGPAATLQTPVAEAKTDYDVDLHRPRAGDTYATVSKAYYSGAQYTEALQAFNKNQPIERLGEVQVPPVHVIRKFAPARAGDPAPDRFTPTRPAATDDGPEWGAPGAAQGGQTVYTLFKVPRTGMTLRDVAKTFYGNERNWAKLNNPRNPKFEPGEELPAGTQLQVPTESLPSR